MPHTTTNLLVHFIFSTKQRCALIKPEFEKDLHAYLGGIVRQIGGTALLRQWHSRSRASSCAGTGKSIRRRRGTLDKDEFFAWVHGRWPEQCSFGWQTGYGAFTVSESGVGAVRDYISNQQEHHRVRSFQEEFLAFLKKNGIVVGERYLWG